MNLRTYIDTELKKEKNTTFMISAGSGFFFIGTFPKFEQDITKINAEYERNHKSQLPKLMRKIQELETSKLQELEADEVDKAKINNINDKINNIKKACEQFKKPYIAFLEKKLWMFTQGCKAME